VLLPIIPYVQLRTREGRRDVMWRAQRPWASLPIIAKGIEKVYELDEETLHTIYRKIWARWAFFSPLFF
jgi:hypothetical protein